MAALTSEETERWAEPCAQEDVEKGFQWTLQSPLWSARLATR